MAKRISLREFQKNLAQQLALARRGDARQALLGVESGKDSWLLDLSDAGEVLPVPPLTTVPLTKPWFAGVANVRGVLYSVVDFSAFRGGEPTRGNADARLLLVGARHGINSALMVDRTLGLKSADELEPVATEGDGPPWVGIRRQDAQGRQWTLLKLQALLADPAFLDVGS
jgi:twitching motility protein PilI